MKPKTLLQLLTLLALLVSTLAAQEIPITTSSDEARALYIRARELSERFHPVEPKQLLEQALAKDSTFALAMHDLAFFQTTNKGIRSYITKALTLSEKASQGEQLGIQIAQANLNGDQTKRKELTEQLLKLYPNDKRAQQAMGTFYYFTLNQPEAGIPFLKKAIDLDPAFHSAYNNLGYAYASLGNYDEAEKALKKYTELLPNESNPHDSYAEILMKQGKFEESIVEYKKSLVIDPKFSLSQVGLGTNYVFIGKADDGRKQFDKMYKQASDDNDRAQALIAMTKSYLIEGRFDKAMEEQRKNYALSQKQNDPFGMSGDLLLSAWILSEDGKAKEASMEVHKAAEILKSVPRGQAEAMALGLLRTDTRVETKSGDISKTKSKLEEYKKKAESLGNAMNMKLAHLFASIIASREKRYDEALSELQDADQLYAYTLFITAQVHAAKGDKEKAKDFFNKAANFNDMSWEYAFVRKKAKEALAKLK